MKYEILITYADGLVARMSHRGRTTWTRKSAALKHAREFEAMNHDGVLSVCVTPC